MCYNLQNKNTFLAIKFVFVFLFSWSTDISDSEIRTKNSGSHKCHGLDNEKKVCAYPARATKNESHVCVELKNLHRGLARGQVMLN